MELILDTADVEAIKKYSQMLNVSGVTTNPKIIASTGKQPRQAAEDVLAVLSDDQKFFMQATSTDYDGIMADAEFVCGLRPKNNYVKIPCTPVGLRAIKDCKAAGMNVLGTCVFSAELGFFAALNGADYLAPYVNRMSQYTDGIENTNRLIDMLAMHDMPTKVMGASWHNIAQVRDLIEAGIDAVTVDPGIIDHIVENYITASVVDDFSDVWTSSYGRSSIAE